MTTEQLTAYISEAIVVCGIVANFLPQEWRITKILTKIGGLTFRAQTKENSKP